MTPGFWHMASPDNLASLETAQSDIGIFQTSLLPQLERYDDKWPLILSTNTCRFIQHKWHKLSSTLILRYFPGFRYYQFSVFQVCTHFTTTHQSLPWNQWARNTRFLPQTPSNCISNQRWFDYLFIHVQFEGVCTTFTLHTGCNCKNSFSIWPSFSVLLALIQGECPVRPYGKRKILNYSNIPLS